MKISSILEFGGPKLIRNAVAGRDSKSDIEVDLPLAGVFMTSVPPSPELLAWVRNVATLPYVVKYLIDDRVIIGVTTKHDAYSIRAGFAAELEASIVLSSRSATDVARDIDRRDRRS